MIYLLKKGGRLFFILLTFSICNQLRAQVYNYSPVNYRDIETNPAIVASKDKNHVLNLNYQNTIAKSKSLSYSSIQFSKYLSRAFCGFGLTLNNTTVSNRNYKYVALSAGYRTILLNEALFRIGATYKLIHSDKGIFEYFISPDSSTGVSNVSKANLSFSLSTDADNYYISYGVANIDLPWDTKSINQFPTYSILHIGNLMSLFDRNNSEISYTAFRKKTSLDSRLSYSHYIDLKFVFLLSRNVSLRYGTRVGYTDNRLLHCIPFLTCYSRKAAFTLFYNTYIITKTSRYPSSIQLNLIYKL